MPGIQGFHGKVADKSSGGDENVVVFNRLPTTFEILKNLCGLFCYLSGKG